MSKHDSLFDSWACDCIYLDIPNMCLAVAMCIYKHTDANSIRNADDSLVRIVYNAFDVQHHNCVATSDSMHTLTTKERR